MTGSRKERERIVGAVGVVVEEDELGFEARLGERGIEVVAQEDRAAG